MMIMIFPVFATDVQGQDVAIMSKDFTGGWVEPTKVQLFLKNPRFCMMKKGG